MKIAIIGSEGYVGRVLQQQLDGHDLYRIDALVWGQKRKEGVHLERTSRGIFARLDQFKPDHVVVLAALAHDPGKLLSRRAVIDNTFNVPLSCVEWGIMNHVSTTAISSLSVHASGHYPESKRMLERSVMRNVPWQDVNILRFGTLYGPGADGESWRGHLLLNKMVYDARDKGVVNVAVPNLRRPVLHVSAAAAAIVESIFSEGPRGVFSNHVGVCETIAGFAQQVVLAVGGTVVTGAIADLDKRDYGWKTWEHRLPALRSNMARLSEWINEKAFDIHASCGEWDRLNEWARRNYP